MQVVGISPLLVNFKGYESHRPKREDCGKAID
jgi:hypothetical protein